MRRYNYIIEDKNISKEDAIALLQRLASDEAFIGKLKRKATVWAKDRVGLTMPQIAKAYGKRAKSTIHAAYHKEKGGRS